MSAASSTRPTYAAVVRAAVDATGAAHGWLLRLEDDHFVVVAVLGADASVLVGQHRPPTGIAAFVAASGQPAAVQVQPSDMDNIGAGGAPGVPESLLAAPCATTEVLGVIELANATAGTFSFDDVETLSLLADVAGAALAEHADIAPPVTPELLAASLAQLAVTDPSRYAEVARVVEALL